MLLSGVFSGLTLGLMGLDIVRHSIAIADTDQPAGSESGWEPVAAGSGEQGYWAVAEGEAYCSCCAAALYVVEEGGREG